MERLFEGMRIRAQRGLDLFKWWARPSPLVPPAMTRCRMEPISQIRIYGNGPWLEGQVQDRNTCHTHPRESLTLTMDLTFTQVDCLTPQIQSQLERAGTRRKCQEFTRQWVRVVFRLPFRRQQVLSKSRAHTLRLTQCGLERSYNYRMRSYACGEDKEQ